MSGLERLWQWRGHLLLLVASGLPAAFSFVFIPIIITATSMEQYGKFAAFQSMLLGVNLIAGLSSAGYIANAHVIHERRNVIFNSMIFILILSFPLVLVAAALIDSYIVHGGWTSVLIMSACTIATYINSLYGSFLLLKKKYISLVQQSAAQLVSQYICVIVLMKLGVMSAMSLSMALLCGASCGVFVCLRFDTGLWLNWGSVSAKEMRRVIGFGFPLMFHFFLSISIGNFDRWYLSYSTNSQLLAQYSVALTLAAAAMMILDVFNKIYSPKVYELLMTREFVLVAHFSIQALFIVQSMFVTLFVYVFGCQYIDWFINSNYGSVKKIFGFMLIANMVYIVYYIAVPYLYFFNKTRYILYSSGLGVMAVVLLFASLSSPVDAWLLVAVKGIGFFIMGLATLFWAWLCFKLESVR